MGKHGTASHAYDALDPHAAPDRLEVGEIADVLRAMPLNPDDLGDGSTSDWTLCVLLALAGRGDTDTLDYMAPRLEAAALEVLAEIGYPGPAFEGG